MAGAVVGALTLSVGLWLGVAVSALLSAVVTLLGHLRHRQDRRLDIAESAKESALR
jgi:hypothetical protein